MLEPDLEQTVNLWTALYRQLLELSELQLDEVKTKSQNEQFSDFFSGLSGEWARMQGEILLVEQQLKRDLPKERMAELFQSHIEPILAQTQENTRNAGKILDRSLSSTGNTIRSARDHKQATKAYFGTEQENHASLFFDEKK